MGYDCRGLTTDSYKAGALGSIPRYPTAHDVIYGNVYRPTYLWHRSWSGNASVQMGQSVDQPPTLI